MGKHNTFYFIMAFLFDTMACILNAVNCVKEMGNIPGYGISDKNSYVAIE